MKPQDTNNRQKNIKEKMRNFNYPVLVELEDDAKVLSCRDIPQANAFTYDESIQKTAQEMLQIALSYYFKEKLYIPPASKAKKGEEIVVLPPSFVLKIILHNAMLENNIRNADIAKALDVPQSEVARIVDYRRKTKIDTMALAISAAGESLTLTY